MSKDKYSSIFSRQMEVTGYKLHNKPDVVKQSALRNLCFAILDYGSVVFGLNPWVTLY